MEESQDLYKNGKRAIVHSHAKHVSYHDSLACHALLPTNYVCGAWVREMQDQSKRGNIGIRYSDLHQSFTSFGGMALDHDGMLWRPSTIDTV